MSDDRKYLKAAEGRIVRREQDGAPWPERATGRSSRYLIRRRLDDGDLVEAEPPKPARPASPKATSKEPPMINLNEIPYDWRPPGTLVEVRPNYSNMGLVSFPTRVVAYVQKLLAAGTAVAGSSTRSPGRRTRRSCSAPARSASRWSRPSRR